MCEYCGCQQIDVIGELTAEHDRLRDLGHDLAGATRSGNLSSARRYATAMREVLDPHTAVEERGLFPALMDDFADRLRVLVDEHRTIDAALAAICEPDIDPPPDWQADVLDALNRLFEHILKEQDGVFPAALATLGPTDWEAIAAVRSSSNMRDERSPAMNE
jgi:hemerythrin-like domain-containing protein